MQFHNQTHMCLFSGLEPFTLAYRYLPLTSSSRHNLEHPCHYCFSFPGSPDPCFFVCGVVVCLALSLAQPPCSKKCAFSQSPSFAKCLLAWMSSYRLQTSTCRHFSLSSQTQHFFTKYSLPVILHALSPRLPAYSSQFCSPLLVNQAFS